MTVDQLIQAAQQRCLRLKDLRALSVAVERAHQDVFSGHAEASASAHAHSLTHPLNRKDSR